MSLDDLFRGDSALVDGRLRGYRAWRGLAHGGQHEGRLLSTGMAHTWRKDAHTEPEGASCLTYLDQVHFAPDAHCRCGIYGWYDPADERIPHPAASGSVFGVVQATGRVILGTHGFRAEKAQVLAVTADDPGQREQLRSAGYRVFDSRDELLAAYPPDDVSGLVDHDCDGTCQGRALESWSFVTQVSHTAHVHWASLASMTASWQQVQAAFTQGGLVVQQVAAAVTAEADKVREERKAASAADPRRHALEQRRQRGTGPGAPNLFRAALRRRRS
jgi:hypothetical protein